MSQIWPVVFEAWRERESKHVLVLKTKFYSKFSPILGLFQVGLTDSYIYDLIQIRLFEFLFRFVLFRRTKITVLENKPILGM